MARLTHVERLGFEFEAVVRSRNERAYIEATFVDMPLLARVSIDSFFDSMSKVRAVSYAKAFSNSKNIALLGGRMGDVSHLFITHIIGDDAFVSPMTTNNLASRAIAHFLDLLLDGMTVLGRSTA
jgi:hypothetical protein